MLRSVDIIQEQGRIWAQTLDDHLVTDEPLQAPNQQLMYGVQGLVGRLVSKAKQLIQNSTKNIVENWMQIRCKFDGGKVINRIQSGSFQFRCCGAGLQKISVKLGEFVCGKKMTGSPANEFFINAADSSAKRAKLDREWKSTEKSQACRRRNTYSQRDDSIAACKAYSRHDGLIEPDDIVDDISPECLNDLKRTFYTTQVVVSAQDRTIIEQLTREQSGCTVWLEE